MPRSQTQLRNPKDRSAQKPAQKRKNGRSLNALSIAEKQIPTKLGVRRSRLGAYDDGSNRKRHTGGDDEDEEEETPHYKRRRTEDTGSLDGGSDSEGHEWTLGQVNSDDDSELDSDEALGESDEERFEGFTFRASKSKNTPKKATPKSKKPVEVNLDEDDESEEESDGEDYDEDEDDDLGEDAVDLATAWDLNAAADEEEAKEAAKKSKRAAKDSDSEDDSGSEAESDSDTSMDGLSASGNEDEADPHGLSKLQDFVQSMETGKPTKRTQKSQEQAKPSEYGLTSSNKLTIADLLPSITDTRLKNSLKHIDSVVKSSKAGIPGKLDAPLAKRQQDRLDRTAAYEKSKETLNRWLDTVKANRRAEHLSFPLRDPDAEQSRRLEVTKPQTDLESAIQNILVESGLAEAEGKTAEDQIQEIEELQARNIPVEEIQARRAELRKRRDLLFREEVRAKRIKKIKSKSYRRVHRKEREREEQKERQALMEAGVDPDEMDQQDSERKRAEARMGSKHRDSKWAKSLKQTGRTAWDEDARNSAADLAQREDELRRRIEGKRTSKGDDYLDSSSSESEEEDPWNEEDPDMERQKLQKKLDALESKDNSGAVKGPHADLFEMKFMKNADAARKEQNDAELRQLNRKLHGEDSQSEAESEVGRRKFGQTQKSESKSHTKPLPKNEFEENLDSDDEDRKAAESDNDMESVVDRPAKQQSGARGSKTASQSSRKSSNQQKEAAEEAPTEENPWLVQTERNNRRRTGPDAQESIDISLDATPEVPPAKTQSKKQNNDKAARAKKQIDEENDSEDEENVPVLLKNHDLVKRAFAGDEVVQEFEQDKMDTIEDEGDKVVDNTLDGWGSWAGEGISKRQQKKQNQKRDLTTITGVKPQQRKDAKLDRVIINQKRIQKVRVPSSLNQPPFTNLLL